MTAPVRMTGPRIGSLFSGYGGLDMGVQAVFGGTVAWHSDIEPGPSRILAHHWPDVPNLGDITQIDWTQVEPVDIICGGSPCQDLSSAGRRAGMRDGTRSGLWASMCEAIETIRPAYVIWENVLGALSASAASDMGPCKLGMGCEGSVSLRALGRVLGDLTEVGYDAAWTTIAAADIGAPHRRERVFVLAWPADSAGDQWWVNDREHGTSADSRDDGLGVELPGGSGAKVAWPAGPTTHSLLRTPNARDGDSRGTQPPERRLAGGHQPSLADQVEHLLPSAAMLLPTPSAARDGNTPESHLARKPGRTKVTSLDVVLNHQLLPTPTTEPNTGNGHARNLGAEVRRWGEYGPAIARWEALTRPAPAPTQPSARTGRPQLSPRFVEWMMGLPDGHVTCPTIWEGMTPTAARHAELRALGNGVVHQQAAVAIWELLAMRETALRGAA